MDFVFIYFFLLTVCFSENSTSRNDDGCQYIEPPLCDEACVILTGNGWTYLAMCDFGFAFPDGSTTKEFECIVDVDDKGEKTYHWEQMNSQYESK